MARRVLKMLVAAMILSGAPARGAENPEFVFGLLTVGPYNDHGWSQATYDGCKYVEANVPGSRLVYVDKVNPADRPGTTAAQLAESLAAKKAKLVIFNSDDMKDGAVEFAKAHPDVKVIHLSGDTAWKEGQNHVDLPNVYSLMCRMEYGEMIAGFAAAMTTRSGKIGYLGPLINDETRRLAAATFLGAKYAWAKYLGRDPKDLVFKVTWIGFWFNIPGVTADPTRAADDFFASGFDVLLSGLDTTEALVEAKKARDAGKRVWASPYDFAGACGEAPDVCIGVPYFNWGPALVRRVRAIREDRWTPGFEWAGPDWKNINDPDSSAVGFQKGAGLGAEASAKVDEFVKELAGGLNLWVGPMNFQSGSPYLKDGETATDLQVWYLPQLLQGMEGQSTSAK